MPQTLSIGAALGSALPFGLGQAQGLGTESLGISSLFGQVLGVGLTEGTEAPATEAPQTLTFTADGGLLIGVNQFKLGDVPISVQGIASEAGTEQTGLQAQALTLITQRVTVLYQKISTQGLNFSATTPVGEYAAALTQLGIPAEEAQGIAKQFQTLLSLLDKQLGTAEPTQAATPTEPSEAAVSLGAALLASLVAAFYPQLADALNGNISGTSTLSNGAEGAFTATQTSQVSLQISVTQTFSQSTRVVSWQGGALSARDALVQAEGAQNVAPQNRAAVLPSAQSTPQLTLTVVAQTQPETIAQNTAPNVQVALPNGLAAAAQVAAQAASVPQPTLQKIEAPKALNGKVLYTLTETAGQTVLQIAAPQAVPQATPSPQVSPQSEGSPEALVLEPSLTTPTPTAEGTPAVVVNTANPLAKFTELLHQAQSHNAAGQVAVAIQTLVKQGSNGTEGSAVRLVLNPPELGRIEIHLKIEAGTVSGAIQATEPAAIEHLARELPTLKQAFTDAGLKLGEQGLSLMLGQNSEHNNGQNPNASNPFAADDRRPNARSNGLEGADEPLAPEPLITAGRWIAPERVLDREV